MMSEEDRARYDAAWAALQRDLDALLTPFIQAYTEAARAAMKQVGDAARAAFPEMTKEPAHPEG